MSPLAQAVLGEWASSVMGPCTSPGSHGLSFHFYKMGMMIASASQGGCDDQMT